MKFLMGSFTVCTHTATEETKRFSHDANRDSTERKVIIFPMTYKIAKKASITLKYSDVLYNVNIIMALHKFLGQVYR
jgi:hypothetical protein